MKRQVLTIALVIFYSQLLPAQQTYFKMDITRLSIYRDIPGFGNSLFYTDTTLTREYYLEKSKNQRTVAWVMLGGGIALSIVGIVGASATLFDDNNAADTYGAVAAIGVGLSLGSIPFFIASGRNARKAATLSFKAQPVYLPQQNYSVRKSQPAISVHIPL
jgi:hypothetical protein